MKGTVKIIALAVATLMMLSAMPMNAFADEPEQQTEITNIITEETTTEEITTEQAITEETAQITQPYETQEQPFSQTQETVTVQSEEGSVARSEDAEGEVTLTIEETVTVVFEIIEDEIIGSSNIVIPQSNHLVNRIDASLTRAIAGEYLSPNESRSLITSNILPDGVYAIKNLGNLGLWMDTQYNSSDPGYHIQQYAFGTTSPTDTFSRSGLFKISQQGNTGRYVIRLMLNNKLSFGVQGGKIITKEIPTIDADVAPSDTFYITYSSGYYTIRPHGSDYVICAQNTTASGASGAPDSYLYAGPLSNAGNQAKWQMYQYTGEHRSSTVLAYPSSWAGVGIPVGDSGTVTSKTWSTRIGANTPYMRAVENSTQMVSTIWSFMDNRMTLTAKSPGEAGIYSMILYGTSEPAVYTGLMYVDILAQEGTHFIKNVATDRCIDIEGPSRAEGAIIQQWTHSTANQKKWIVEHVSDGYIRLKSVYSGLYVGVDSANTSLVKQYSTQNDYTLWKMERTASGNIKLVCKAVTGGYVLAPPSATSGNGADLTMTTYTNDTDYRDEWEIFEDVTFGDYLFDIGNMAQINIQTDCANNVISYTDFTYSISGDSSCISINESTGVITALQPISNLEASTAIVTATHKDSGISYPFEVNVFSNNLVVSIFAYFGIESSSAGNWVGHAFLTFYNNSKTRQRIGEVWVYPQEEISIGLFGFENEHNGVWYNREARSIQVSNETNNRVSLTKAISLENIEDINVCISTNNDQYDLLSYNCCHFAVEIWNLDSSNSLELNLFTPASLQSLIMQQSTHETNRAVTPVTYFGYYNQDENKFICSWGGN